MKEKDDHQFNLEELSAIMGIPAEVILENLDSVGSDFVHCCKNPNIKENDTYYVCTNCFTQHEKL